MDSIFKDVKTIEIGFLVTQFLQKTKRLQQAIQLYEECLMLLLNNSEWLQEDNFKLLYFVILKELLFAYYNISDLKNVERCSKELLVMSKESGDTHGEGWWSFILAYMYLAQYKGRGKRGFSESIGYQKSKRNV